MDHQLPTPMHHTPAVGDPKGWKSQILHHKPTHWCFCTTCEESCHVEGPGWAGVVPVILPP